MTKSVEVIAATPIKMVPLNKLVLSPENVRKQYNKTSIKQLATSITHQGLLQNLVIQKGKRDLFEVTAGGRRYRALRELLKNKKIEPSYSVPCRWRKSDNAIEVSLAENIIREQMHPADEIEAFGKLHREGTQPEEIGARFGISGMTVRRRLKLAGLSPKILSSFRQGEATLQQIEALSLSDDHAVQEEVFFEGHEWERQPHQIRAKLSKDGLAASSKLARFIGVEVYEQAGGQVVRDLFDDKNAGYLSDGALVVKLAQEKLEAEAKVYDGKGWKWVVVDLDGNHFNYSNLSPLVTYNARDQKKVEKLLGELEMLHEADEEGEEAYEKIEKIEASLKALEQANQHWADDQKAVSGVLVTISHESKVTVHEGLQSREENLAARRLEAHGRGDAKPAKKEGAGLSAAVIEDLTKTRTAALGVALADQPAVAIRALAFTLSKQLLQNSHNSRCFKINASEAGLRMDNPDTDNSKAFDELATRKRDMLALLPSDELELWNYLLAVSMQEVERILALCVGLSFDAVTPRFAQGDQHSLALAGLFAASLSVDMREWWKPSVAYFGRVSKSIAAQSLLDAGLPAAAVEGFDKLKKAAAVETTVASLEGKDWIPVALTTYPSLTTTEAPLHGHEVEEDLEVAA